MNIHPKILQRAQENVDRKYAEILSQRESAVGKLEDVRAFLHRSAPSSDIVDVNDLIDEIEAIIAALAIDRMEPDEIIRAGAEIARRMRLVYAVVKFMAVEHAPVVKGKTPRSGVVAPRTETVRVP